VAAAAVFRYDESVAGADRGEGPVQAGVFAIRAGQPVVEVDPVLSDTELDQSLPLSSEVLGVGGAASVADQGAGHGQGATG
jgi:hypothetical protein